MLTVVGSSTVLCSEKKAAARTGVGQGVGGVSSDMVAVWSSIRMDVSWVCGC